MTHKSYSLIIITMMLHCGFVYAITPSAQSNDYRPIIYVDTNSGDDNFSGMYDFKVHVDGRLDGPLKTINAGYEKARAPGTKIIVKGGVYREEIVLHHNHQIEISGKKNDFIRPVVSGADIIDEASWKSCDEITCEPILPAVRKHVFYADISFETKQIYQTNTPLKTPRYPETGYVKIDLDTQFIDSKGLNSFKVPALTENGIDLSNALCHIRTRLHRIEHVRVKNHRGAVVHLERSIEVKRGVDPAFYCTNIISLMRNEGEWSFDFHTNRIYIYPLQTGLRNIEASRRQYGFTSKGRGTAKHVIEGFTIQKTTQSGISLSDVNEFRVANNIIEHTYLNGINIYRSSYLEIQGNHISHANSRGIFIDNDTTHSRIVGNHIHAIGAESYGADLLAGRGEGIVNYAIGTVIQHNTIDRTGYDGIYLGQDVSGSDISYNKITNSLLSLADGGAIYTGRAATGRTLDNIHHNIIDSCFGYTGGLSDDCTDKSELTCHGGAHGIYLDERASGRNIYRNTVTNCSTGLFLHWGGNNTINSNVFYGNNNYQVLLKGINQPDRQLVNVTFNDNVLISKNSNAPALGIVVDNTCQGIGYLDHNTYAAQRDERLIYYKSQRTGRLLDLSTWKRVCAQDQHSHYTNTKNFDRDPDLFMLLTNLSVNHQLMSIRQEYCTLNGVKLGQEVEVGGYESVVVKKCR